MKIEYYVKRLPGVNGGNAFQVSKFPDGATEPESSYTIHEERGHRQCECKGFLNRGRCRHQPMIDEFIERGEPSPCVIVREE